MTKGITKENKTGRPSKNTRELQDIICGLLSEGISLRTICLREDMPDKSNVFKWLREDKQFRDQYAQAKEESTDAQLEELADISNEAIGESKIVDPKRAGAVVQAYKVKGDNMKWVMSKMKPKKYGDKLALGGDSDQPLEIVIKKL